MKTINEYYVGESINNDKVIIFNTLSSFFIFSAEVRGQISDGYWENSRPNKHWYWLRNIEVKYDKNAQPGTNRSMMLKYNLDWMVKYVRKALKGDKELEWAKRMLKYGRFGRVCPEADWKKLDKYEMRAFVEYLPDEPCTMEQLEELYKDYKKDYYNYAKTFVTDKILEKYYNTEYGISEFMDDLDDLDVSLNSTFPSDDF